jgi:hypothetical protein
VCPRRLHLAFLEEAGRAKNIELRGWRRVANSLSAVLVSRWVSQNFARRMKSCRSCVETLTKRTAADDKCAPRRSRKLGGHPNDVIRSLLRAARRVVEESPGLRVSPPHLLPHSRRLPRPGDTQIISVRVAAQPKCPGDWHTRPRLLLLRIATRTRFIKLELLGDERAHDLSTLTILGDTALYVRPESPLLS